MEMALARSRIEEILQAYVDQSKVAEKNRKQEHRAVLLIQCAWRRKVVYKQLRILNLAATQIQRLFRGHLGREKQFLLSGNRNEQLRIAYFNEKANRIQKHFRGFMSRKHIHSFIARKEFLQDVLSKGNEVKEMLHEFLKNQCIREFQSAEKKAREEIEKLYKTSHFLLSTDCKAGVYDSPSLNLIGNENPIEDKIRDARSKQNCVGEMRKLGRRRRQCQEKLQLWRTEFVAAMEPYETGFQKRLMEDRHQELEKNQSQEFMLNLKIRRGFDKGAALRRKTKHGYKPPKESESGWMKISGEPFVLPRPAHRRMFSCGGK